MLHMPQQSSPSLVKTIQLTVQVEHHSPKEHKQAEKLELINDREFEEAVYNGAQMMTQTSIYFPIAQDICCAGLLAGIL